MTDTLRRPTWDEVMADGGRGRWRKYLQAIGLKRKNLVIPGQELHTSPERVEFQHSPKRGKRFLRTTLRRDRVALPSDPLAETFEKV